MKSRQQTDNRNRYDSIVIEIRRRYPPDTKIPLSALRTIMASLDIRAKDKRTQDTWLMFLESPAIYGEAVLEKVGHKTYRVLPTEQQTIERMCAIAELVTV